MDPEVMFLQKRRGNLRTEDVKRMLDDLHHSDHVDLEEVATHAEGLRQHSSYRKYNGGYNRGFADPAVLGLLAFGMTMLITHIHNFGGYHGWAVIMAYGFIIGGVIQLLAGLQAFFVGKSFYHAFFSIYGGYWIAQATLIYFKSFKLADATTKMCADGNCTMSHGNKLGFSPELSDGGWLLFPFLIISVFFLIGSFKVNMSWTVMMLSTVMGYLLWMIEHFLDHKSKANKATQMASGAFFVIAVIMAVYMAFALMFNDLMGRVAVPLGPSLVDLAMKMKDRKVKE